MALELKQLNKKQFKRLILLTLRDAAIATILLCVGVYFLLSLYERRIFLLPRKRQNPEFGTHDRYLNTSTLIESKISSQFNKTSKKKIKNTLKNILLILVYNFPHYKNVKYTHEMYKHIFYDVVSCGSIRDGENPDIVLAIAKGYYGYGCAAEAMKRFPGLEGYLYGNDDMIINWWTLVNLPKSKIWHGAKFIDYSLNIYSVDDENMNWKWWRTDMGKVACQNFYRSLLYSSENTTKLNSKKLFKNYINGCNGKPCCGRSWADFFYIPEKMANDFIFLSKLAFGSNLFLEIALPNIILSLTNSADDIIAVKSIYLYDYNVQYFDTRIFWDFYNFNISFIHPFKLSSNDGNDELNVYLLRNFVIPYGKNMLEE